MRDVLKLPAYRRLLAAYTLNELAYSIGSLALALLVYRRTGSAIAAAAYFLCAMFGPALVSPVVVARLDPRPWRSVLAALYALEAAFFAALAWVAGHFALAPALALALLDGIAAATARALARAATVSVTSAAGLLREANALTNASFSGCYMIGPALAGAAVSVGGTATALLIDCGVFMVIALTFATGVGLGAGMRQGASVRGRLRSALRYARAQPLVRKLLSLQAAAMLFGTIPIPIDVVLAEHTLHGGASGYGLLLSGWGAGAVIGSAIYARWRAAPLARLVGSGTCCMGIGIVVMGLAPTLVVAILGAGIAGVGNGTLFVASRTALQERVRKSWMALIMSLNESIYQALPGAGILIGGALTAVAGPRFALAAGGIGAITASFIAWLALQRGAHEAEFEPESAEPPPLGALTEAGRLRQAGQVGVLPARNDGM
jgi:hypothetical protein